MKHFLKKQNNRALSYQVVEFQKRTNFQLFSLNFSSRPPAPGLKSNKALDNDARNGTVKPLKDINKKVNNCIAVLSQKRIDSSIEQKQQQIDTILEQIHSNLNKLLEIYEGHIMIDKPKGKSAMYEKLMNSGKFTEEEVKDFLSKK